MKDHAVVCATPPRAWAHVPVVLPAPVLAGAGLVAAATLTGAWLARRHTGQRQIWFAAAAGALLIVAGLHLLPDAWAATHATGIWPPLVLVAAAAGFAVAGLATRGCGCREHQEQASGATTAAALAVHRFLEGAAVALALAAHAFAEGLATGALLGGQPRRRVAGWLALMCLSPVIGAATTDTFPVPAAAEPVLLALATGVLAQAARVSLRAAFRGLRPSPPPALSPRRDHHHGRHHHRAGRARGRLSFVRAPVQLVPLEDKHIGSGEVEEPVAGVLA